MNTVRILILSLCVCSSLTPTTSNAIISFNLDPKSVSELRTAFTYTTVGTGIALGGVYLATLGIKKLCTSDNDLFAPENTKNTVLAATGCTALYAGIRMALGK